ncbi:hypothetical protein [Brachyspira pilosicoli]|uniref:hypothetical protein n=1 Tax=Brachyspira pilosicoli TaxID=52584 RepID=UPI000C794D0E|nr:hypothetical protein [Brachyspira pilosicoli]PLV59638.1 hypothetical protein BPSP16_07245 [Brachyspira pilosicoli SP16]
MKNIKLFNKILLSIGIIFIILTSILFLLGRINREGYLSKLSIKVDATLQLNNIDIETTKEMFSSDDKLDYSLLTNYIFTNSNISKYSYDFRISYYSKVFKNSDIYGVYLNTNSLPDYVSDVQFKEKGSPFGILVSSEIIKQEKIDSIQYFLQIKYHLFVIIIMSIYLSIILLYKFGFIIIDFIKIIYNIKLLKNINLKNKYLYILVIFLCFLIIPNIIYILFGQYFDKTNYENRLKAQKPILSITNLVNYPLQYEKYFNDHISFRNELIQLKNVVDIIIFKNIISDRVLLGKDNVLFHKGFYDIAIKDYIGIDKFSNEELDIAKNNLLHFRDELRKKNIDFIFMICPSKEYIYSEYIPSYIKRKDNMNSIEYFISYMNKNTDIKIVYLKSPLSKYKYDYYLYPKYGAHWEYISGYIAYTELLKKLGFDFISLENSDIINVTYVPFWHDLADLVSITKYFSHNDNQKFYKVAGYTNYKILEGINNHMEYLFTESKYKDAINSNIFMIRDSFSQTMVDYISSKFKYASFSWFLTFNIDKIIKNKPNVVVLELLELDIKDKLLNILPSYKIEEINKDLETNYIKSNN